VGVVTGGPLGLAGDTGLGRFLGGLGRLGSVRVVTAGRTSTAGRTITVLAPARCGCAVTRTRVCRLGGRGEAGACGSITTGGAAECESGGSGCDETVVVGCRKLPRVKVRATNPTAQAAARARIMFGKYPFAGRRCQPFPATRSATASMPADRLAGTSARFPRGGRRDP
jgi:hypothetical protein